jgi:hypothetical protein
MWRTNEVTLKEMRGLFIERHRGQLRGGRNSGDCGETTDGSVIRVTSAR